MFQRFRQTFYCRQRGEALACKLAEAVAEINRQIALYSQRGFVVRKETWDSYGQCFFGKPRKYHNVIITKMETVLQLNCEGFNKHSIFVDVFFKPRRKPSASRPA